MCRRRDVTRRRGCLPVKTFEEFADGLVGIEPDLDRIRADEGAAEDAAGQLGDVVALERFEGPDRDLGTGGNLPQRDAAPLARLAQPPAKIVDGHEVVRIRGDGGLSAEFGEDDLGGLAVRFRFMVGN